MSDCAVIHAYLCTFMSALCYVSKLRRYSLCPLCFRNLVSVTFKLVCWVELRKDMFGGTKIRECESEVVDLWLHF